VRIARPRRSLLHRQQRGDRGLDPSSRGVCPCGRDPDGSHAPCCPCDLPPVEIDTSSVSAPSTHRPICGRQATARLPWSRRRAGDRALRRPGPARCSDQEPRLPLRELDSRSRRACRTPARCSTRASWKTARPPPDAAAPVRPHHHLRLTRDADEEAPVRLAAGTRSSSQRRAFESQTNAADLTRLAPLGWSHWPARPRPAVDLRWRDGRPPHFPLERRWRELRREPSFVGATPRSRCDAESRRGIRALKTRVVERSRRPDSNRGPLHYE
jgi:hypothetical protein